MKICIVNLFLLGTIIFPFKKNYKMKLSLSLPELHCEPLCRDPSSGSGRGRSEPRRRWPSGVPEQGLLGGRRLRPVCARAGRRLLGHLLVDVPGGHCDPQHGGQCGVVQHDAHLAGERQVSGRRARAGPRPPAPWRPQDVAQQ